MTTSFLTPILTKHFAEIESEVAQAIADINTRLLGVTAAAASTKPSTPSMQAKGGKRSPEALEQLTKRLLSYISKNPGERIEQIGKALGVATKELSLPIRKLASSNQVRTRGQKRATSYTAR